jgi:cellobiose-specific phosphotransferase system component IIC
MTMKALRSKKISVIGSIIKTSLAMVIPILFIGSITVLLNGFPVQAYQDFLDSFWGGALRKLIQIIQSTTVGNLAIYMTVALNLCYMNQAEEGQRLAFKFGRSSWFYAFPKI